MGTADVTGHYTRGDLLRAILDGLAATGADQAELDPDDLAPVDEMHRHRSHVGEVVQLQGALVRDDCARLAQSGLVYYSGLAAVGDG